MLKKNDDTQKAKKEKPHYHGHRDRLRKKIGESSDAIRDDEILEACLFLSLPRVDTKPIAKDLIKKFESLDGVLNSPISELVNSGLVGKRTAQNLKIIDAATSRRRLSKLTKSKKPVYESWSDIYDYCIKRIAHKQKEEFRVLFINDKNKLIADEQHQEGTVNFTPAYPREIIKRTLEIGASAIILLHNHPSGDITPSKQDINITEKIVKIANTMQIEVLDHIIVGKDGFASLKGMKLVSIWKDNE